MGRSNRKGVWNNMKKISFHWEQLSSLTFCLLYMIASIIYPHIYNTAYKVIVIIIGTVGILQAVKKIMYYT